MASLDAQVDALVAPKPLYSVDPTGESTSSKETESSETGGYKDSNKIQIDEEGVHSENESS